MSGLRRVALLIETSREYGRGLLRGVARYVQQHEPWFIYFRPHGLESSPPRWLTQWHGDGILARIHDRKMAEAVRQTGLPTVDLRGAVPKLQLPAIGPDNREVAELAADHLLGQGFQHFGFCGMRYGNCSLLDVRRDCFKELIEQAGCSYSVFEARGGWHRRIPWGR